MHTKSKQLPQKIMHGAIVAAMNVTPYTQLQVDTNGYTLHHGKASGGQAVHTLKSRIDKTGGKSTITLALGNGGRMTLTTAEAEVAFAQLLPELAEINQGADTAAS